MTKADIIIYIALRGFFIAWESILSYAMGIAKGIPLCWFKEGAQDAEHPSKGTIRFPSEKKWHSQLFCFSISKDNSEQEGYKNGK